MRPSPRSISADATFLDDIVERVVGANEDPKLALDQIKRQKAKNTFQQLSQLCIVGAVAIVLYYDLLLLWPHLGALFWATTCSLVLSRPQRALLALRERLDARLAPYRLWVVAGMVPIYFAVVAAAPSALTIASWTLVLGVALFIMVGTPRTVVAAVLVAIVVLAIAVPVAIILKNSADEINELVTSVLDFVAHSDEARTIFVDFGASRPYRYAARFAESWGARLPAWDADGAKQQAMALISWIGQHAAKLLDVSLLLVNRTSSAVVSFVTFLTFLFYLLCDDPLRFYDGLSPFSEADTRCLLDSLKKSVVRTFFCSLITGMVHAFLTYVSFRICGLRFNLILSTLSGLLSMMPFVGPWVVWVPVSIGFAAKAAPVNAVVIVAVHLFGDFYIDPVIRSYIPGNGYFVGLSIAMGVFVFGPEGVLVGPLLAGITMTLLDMYRDYTAEPDPVATMIVSTPSTVKAAPAKKRAGSALIDRILLLSSSAHDRRNPP